MLKRDSDVIIVGAGPSGCSAAVFLACRGFEVLLIDKARFPRDKVCGDGISASSLAVFDRMGVTGEIEARHPWRIDNIRLTAPSGAAFTEPNPKVPGLRDYGYVMPRRELDDALFRFASGQDGVTALEGARVTGLLGSGERVEGVTIQRGTEEVDLRATFVLGADGVHSTIARQLGHHNREKRHRAFCVRAYFEKVEGLERTIEIHYERSILPGYAWIFPTGPTSANVGVGVGLRFKETRRIQELFWTFVRQNRFAREKLGGAEMVPKSFRGWPIPFGSYPGPRGLGNVLLLGDAGSMVDTLSGEGIFTALESGEIAAHAVAIGLRTSSRLSEVGPLYDRLMWQRTQWREFYPGDVMQRVFDKEALVDLIVTRAAKNRRLARTIVGVIGHRYSKLGLPLQFLRR